VILELVATPPRRALQVLRDALGGDRVQLFGDRLHARVTHEREGADLKGMLERGGAGVSSVRAIVPTLEDVFIERLAEQRAHKGA
jgi:hypothetical protein